ncbi:hypothetical protein OF83DRAFT_1100897 [Amylostereum chailletii]|nr:hypothetical protein OF83DRAFT_1100897 [Amylostereum chailletii]
MRRSRVRSLLTNTVLSRFSPITPRNVSILWFASFLETKRRRLNTDTGQVVEQESTAVPFSRVFPPLPKTDPARQLWERVWGKGAESVFTRRDVSRPDILSAPHNVWTFEHPKFLSSAEDTIECVVRGEYMLAYQYIMQQTIPNDNVSSSTEVVGTDSSLTKVDPAEPAPAEPFPESFKDLESICDPSKTTDLLTKPPRYQGVCVTGHPGIGKTIFNVFILLICLARGQCVMIQFSKHRIYVFDHDGVYAFEDRDFAKQKGSLGAFPPRLWCLVDCNSDIQSVPLIFPHISHYIIQTAFDMDAHFKWRKHSVTRPERTPRKYYMAPWTLDELLIARPFISGLRNASDSQLRHFYSTWGPSLRQACKDARFPKLLEEMEDQVKHKISALTTTPDTFRNYLAGIYSVPFPDNVSHHIVLVQPTKRSRRVPHVSIVTAHVLELFLQSLKLQRSLASGQFYALFLNTPGTHGVAGVLFETKFHQEIYNHSSWDVVRYEKGSGGVCSRVLHDGTQNAYLHIGLPAKDGTGQKVIVDSRVFEHASQLLPAEPFPTETPKSGFNPGTYYRPVAKNMATFDSVIFDPHMEWATVFQCTVSGKHDLKDQGLAWLKDLGVRKVRYILVQPPCVQPPKSIKIPKDYLLFVHEMYQMSFDLLAYVSHVRWWTG